MLLPTEEFRTGYRDAQLKSHRSAIGRAIVHGTIHSRRNLLPRCDLEANRGRATSFFLVGLIVQFRAIRRKKPNG